MLDSVGSNRIRGSLDTSAFESLRHGSFDLQSAKFRDKEKAYRRERLRSGAAGEPSGVEAVVWGAVTGAFGDTAVPSTRKAALGFANAIDERPKISGLAAAMAALIAIDSGLWALAGRLAERIISGDQHDLFAQRILLASRERSRDLHLAIDDWLADRFCGNPFEEIEIRADGKVNTCCSAWMPASIGSIHDQTANQYWNSIEAGEIRASILDGDFSYCSRLHCPKIVQKTLPRKIDIATQRTREIIDNDLIALETMPRRIVLSEDRSCNLTCPSCRTHLIQLKQSESAELDRIFDVRIAPLLKHAEAIKITGSGDPIGSRHFRHVLKRLTETPTQSRRIQLQTNGLLLNEKAWIDLRLDGHVSTIWVSVDAATRITYEKIRRGGSFERLCKNLHFLGQLRADARVDLLRLDFVVQASNFREMPDFVDLARSVGADGVHFLLLRNWGTYAPEEFAALNVASTSHPEHEAFRTTLSDPRLSSTFVDFGNAQSA